MSERVSLVGRLLKGLMEALQHGERPLDAPAELRA